MKTNQQMMKNNPDFMAFVCHESDRDLEEMLSSKNTKISKQPEQTQEIRIQDGKDK